MHEISYTDRSFNPELAGNYQLALQANAGGVAYCITDNTSGQIILFRKHRFEKIILISDLKRIISEVMDSDKVLNLKFSRIRFLGYSRQTTLVPESYYDANLMKSYLSFNDSASDGTILSNYISLPGIYNIFSLPGEIVATVSSYFGHVTFLSQTTTFIRNITSDPDALNRSSVYAGINHDFFDIACTGERKLLLYNTFQYTNETDLLYYILFVYNKMHLIPEKVPLILTGELSSKLSYTDILRQYFADTRCENESDIPYLATGLKQLSASRYMNLLNVYSCESSAEYTGEGK